MNAFLTTSGLLVKSIETVSVSGSIERLDNSMYRLYDSGAKGEMVYQEYACVRVRARARGVCVRVA